MNKKRSKQSKKMDCTLIECNGEKDHVHFLISSNPKTQPSKMVNILKTATSRLIRNHFKEKVAFCYHYYVTFILSLLFNL